MAKFVGVQLTTPFFSCQLWLPCATTVSAPDAMNQMLREIIETIGQVTPEVLDTITVSELVYWSPLEYPVES